MEEMMEIIKEQLKTEYEKGYAEGSLSVRAEVNEAEYKRGLEDAWKEAKKIFDGTYDIDDLDKIFGCGYDLGEIITDNSLHEVKAKIEAYEAKETEIRVGDEVTDGETKAIVTKTNVNGNHAKIYVIYNDGSTRVAYKDDWKKTGRHIDLDLDKIFGEVE